MMESERVTSATFSANHVDCGVLLLVKTSQCAHQKIAVWQGPELASVQHGSTSVRVGSSSLRQTHHFCVTLPHITHTTTIHSLNCSQGYISCSHATSERCQVFQVDPIPQSRRSDDAKEIVTASLNSYDGASSAAVSSLAMSSTQSQPELRTGRQSEEHAGLLSYDDNNASRTSHIDQRTRTSRATPTPQRNARHSRSNPQHLPKSAVRC